MPYELNTTFNISPGATKTFTFDGPDEADDNFSCYIMWGRPEPTKDLKLEVTRPDGHVITADSDAGSVLQKNAGEVVIDTAPLNPGIWKVVVTNKGSARVRATIQAGFGN